MRMAVTGGGGRLGNVLCRQLVEAGHEVITLELGNGPVPSLDGVGVELRRGSVLDAECVTKLVADADRVFHLAAKVDLNKDRNGMVAKVNIEGTRIVADACNKRGVRMVHTSSHHALDIHPLDETFDETNALALDHKCDYHRSKAVGEKVVLDACKNGLDVVITNPGSMLGPHDYEPSMLRKALVDLYHQKIPIMMDVVSDYVDVRDVAAGMIAAGEKGRRGERYMLTGRVVPIMDFVGQFGEVSGKKMPTRSMPLWVGWALLPAVSLAAKLSGEEPKFNAGMSPRERFDRNCVTEKGD